MPRRDRNRVAKTKSFDGCWTCRRRKVKCDLTRPHCSRCQKGGFSCDGYTPLLHWIDNSRTRPSAIKRKAMMIRFPTWKFGLDEVEEMLARIDTAGMTFQDGPFTVFPKRIPNILRDVDMIPRDCKPTSSVIIPFGHDLSWLATNELHPREQRSNRFFGHYISHVVPVLQPIVHSQNFYAHVYVSQAILGCSSLCGDGTPLPSHRAIFYSLLATAAFHVRGIVKGCTKQVLAEVNQAAQEYRMMAYRFLREAVQMGFKSEMEWLATISAILSFVTIDIMEGSMSEYSLHLEAFQHMNILSAEVKANNALHRSTLRSFLQTAFFLQSTLSETTRCNLTSIPWPSDGDYSKELQEALCQNPAIDGHMLQHTYGLTHTLATFIRSITVLFRHRVYYDDQHQALPNSLVNAFKDQGAQLKSWEVASEVNLLSFDDESEEGALMKRILNLHICAFYHAIQIYFSTHGGQLSTDEDLPFHVDQVAVNLLEIEKMKRESLVLSNQQTASIMWPGFIASCESLPDKRSIWSSWWTKMLHYNIGNIEFLWQTVQDIWQFSDEIRASRQSYDGIPSWRKFFAHTKRSILPL